MSSNKLDFAGSANHQESNEEEEEMSECQQNQQNCSMCLKFISNEQSNESNIKCNECLGKMASIPSGFAFKMVDTMKEYECPICLSMIKNATELNCSHLMCKDCLEYYEKSQIEQHKEKAKFHCCICQKLYQPKEKKFVQSMDRIIQTTLAVKCLQKECNWEGCIEDYQYHQKDCKYILINCEHPNCEVKVKRHLLNKHMSQCDFYSRKCQYCDENIIFKNLQRHRDQCSHYPVQCPNKDCAAVVKRSEIYKHQETECEFQETNCPYFETGCSFKDLRGKMNQHIDTSKVNHDILLLSTVKELKVNSQQKDLEIKELKEWNTKKDKTINVMKQDFEDLKNQFEQQNTQIQQQQENHKSKQIEATQTQQSKRDDQNKENIENLQKFAGTISKLHLTLSQPWLKRNEIHELTLFKESYDKDVMEWNKFINEVNENEIVNCHYLEKLKDSINQYSKTINNPIYEERFLNLCYARPLGTGYPFLRIGCPMFFQAICVKSFCNIDDFDKEVRRNNERRYCKIQNDPSIFSYFDKDDTIYIVLWGAYQVCLLHRSEEEKKIYLPNGEVVNVENIEESFLVYDSIILHLISIDD